MEQYTSYPFDADEQFQQGLADILARNKELDLNEAQLRARVFYFNRITGSSLDINQVRDYEASKKSESEFLTFAQLQELIESGRVDEIPNNKTISGELNADSPSQSTAPARKKPWEVSAGSASET